MHTYIHTYKYYFPAHFPTGACLPADDCPIRSEKQHSASRDSCSSRHFPGHFPNGAPRRRLLDPLPKKLSYNIKQDNHKTGNDCLIRSGKLIPL